MHIDRQQAFSGTTEADIPLGALETYLPGHIADFRGRWLRNASRAGSRTRPTSSPRLTALTFCGVKPFGKLLPSAHAIEREYRVTAALALAGFPVARPLHLCTDDSVIGAAFYVMEHAEGCVFWEPYAPGLNAQDRAALFQSLNATIAGLHSLDAVALGLGDFGKPQGYVARQIKRWSEQYRASETEQVPEMDRLIDWLPAACPSDSGAAIVHGDFRLDNCIVDPPRRAFSRCWTGNSPPSAIRWRISPII